MSTITERSWAQEIVNSMVVLSPPMSFNQIDKKYFLSIYGIVVMAELCPSPKIC